MKPVGLLFAGLVLSLSASQAVASHYTTYVQRQRGETLIIEHNPVPVKVVRRVAYRGKAAFGERKLRPAKSVALRRAGRRGKVRMARRQGYWSSSIAGGCWDGGLVQRPNTAGILITLQREICGSIAEDLPTPGIW
jgi:hypothetical protein